MPRPAIGVCTALEDARWGVWHRRAALLAYEYLLEIERAGGLPLMIPPTQGIVDDPDEVLDRIDGLILAGGADIDPESYGEERHPQTNGTVPDRDRVEIALTRRAVELDMPVLGICRGMQLINVAQGGTLIQHVPDGVGHDEHRRNRGTFEGNGHAVRLDPGSLAARAAGETEHDTLSHHHQAVATLGSDLAVTGYSQLDDLPEAIEAPNHRFVLGVQWHPEADERSRVIRSLVEEAATYRIARGSA
jgi:putative glutamine amidotransferase